MTELEGLESLRLTKRESEVLGLLAKGLSNNEIGVTLSISARTVQKHLERVYVKLGVVSRTAAMAHLHELERQRVKGDSQ